MADLDLNRVGERKAAELQSPIEYDELAAAHVRRKLDWHLMPLFFVLCKYSKAAFAFKYPPP